MLVFGNGGSAADARHFAAKLVGRFEQERQGLAAQVQEVHRTIIHAICSLVERGLRPA
jgi:D-sedoheptulose 7-phosphate isomerase